MSEHTDRLLDRLFDAYGRFQALKIGLPEFQGVVEATLDAVESASDVLSSLKWLAAELERLRFMFPEDEHRSEVDKRMTRFRSELSR